MYCKEEIELGKRGSVNILTNEYGKAVKKKLIDMEMTQTDLAKEVSKELNLKIDTFYIGNILAGRRKSKNVMAAIEKITGVSSNSIPV